MTARRRTLICSPHYPESSSLAAPSLDSRPAGSIKEFTNVHPAKAAYSSVVASISASTTSRKPSKEHPVDYKYRLYVFWTSCGSPQPYPRPQAPYNMWKSSASLLAFVSCTASLNILLTNDDSWASANIRYVYAALVYECVLNPLARH